MNIDKRNAQICRRYVQGYSIREIGKEFGITFQRVQQILTERGIQMRPKHITRWASNYQGRSA